MSKPITPLRLAKSWNQWKEIDQTIAECVSTICEKHDDAEQTLALLTLLDLATNERYDSGNRQSVAAEAIKQAFYHTPECFAARETLMDSLVLPTRQRKTA